MRHFSLLNVFLIIIALVFVKKFIIAGKVQLQPYRYLTQKYDYREPYTVCKKPSTKH